MSSKARPLKSLLWVAGGWFILLSLISYNPQDPGWGQTGGAHIRNWTGLIGAYLSSFLFNFLGLAAFLGPLVCWRLGWQTYKNRPFGKEGIFWLLLILSLALGLGFNSHSGSRYPLHGGIVGFAGQALKPYIGVPGLVILIVLVLGCSLFLGLEVFSSFRFRKPPRKRPRSEPPPPSRPPNRKSHHLRPPLDLLESPPAFRKAPPRETLQALARSLEEKLREFGVEGEVVSINPGPIITVYEFRPSPGVKISRIAALADDLALGLAAESVRIVAPIPGKDVVGIEVSNPERQTVYLREIIESEAYQRSRSPLTIVLGKDISGQPVVADLTRMPHLLIAGATGTGKSVFLHSVILSLIYKASPEKVRLLLIDPKRIELSLYEGLPYLLHPVVLEPRLATKALRWAVAEMERRYQLLEESRARNLDSYNREASEKLPYIVIIIDELADLMVVSSKEVETLLTRLAQMARASGIHLLLATQRPSVDVITGIIKANFPARISFQVSSRTDSRTILDTQGAEKLLGAGDMLFLPPGASKLKRIHAPYVSEKEVQGVIEFLKAQRAPEYLVDLESFVEESQDFSSGEEGTEDALYQEAVKIAKQQGQISVSMLQRRLRIGYNRAARLVERMEEEGLVGPSDGVRPRPVLMGHRS